MSTSTEILDRLREARIAAATAGQVAEVSRLDQQIVAHEHIARLHAQSAEDVATGRPDVAGAMSQALDYWLRMVDERPDDPEPAADGPQADEPGSPAAPASSANSSPETDAEGEAPAPSRRTRIPRTAE